MAFTTENVRTGDGNTTDFSFTFPYINESDVKVTITDANGVPQSNTAFTFANATTLSFTTAPANNRTIRIFRDTNLDNAEVTYFAGSAIRAEDLNDNQNQVLFSAQEVENNAILLTGGTMTGPLVLDDTTLQIQEGSDTLTIDAPALSANRTVSFTDVSGNVVTTGDTGTVTRDMLANSAINAGKLADDSVDSQHYVAGSIDLEHMSANSVDSDQYVDGSIDRVHLAADVIDGTKIADDVVNSEHIAAGAVDLEHMSANSVDSDQYVDGSIDLVHMSANSVDSDQYVDGSIDGVHIANDAIDSQHYAAGSIDNEHLAANSVDSDQYVDGSIDNVHLAANSVTSAKIEDGTIVNADINASAAIAGTKISMSLNQLSDVNVGTPGANQDDQVLAWDNANNEFSLTTVSSGGGGISDIVDDSSPQLGGNLDTNEKEITSASNRNVIINPHGTGLVELGANLDLKGNEIVSTDNATIGIQASGNGDVIINDAGTSTCNFQVQSHQTAPSIFSNGSTGRVGINTNAPTEILDVDGNVRIKDGNNLILQNDAEDHTISINADDVTDSYNLTLPPAHGTANQVLRINAVDNNDNVELEWGTIDVSSSPLLENKLTSDGDITIGGANGGTEARNAAIVGPFTMQVVSGTAHVLRINNGSTFKIL